MKLTLRDQQFSTRRLTGLYIGALSAVALLAVLGQLVIQLALAQQSSDANVINIAGRQRMLSQKLTKSALTLLLPADATVLQTRVQEVRTTASLWENSHQALQRGDARLGLPGNNSTEVTRLFLSIDPNFQAMRDATNNILATVDQDRTKPPATLNNDLSPFIQILLTQSPTFLTGMDAIVSQYQKEAEGRVLTLKITEVGLLALTLLILLLEGLLVFRPAIQRLSKSVTALMKAEEQVAARTAELERKNADLELAFNEAMSAHRKVMPHARVIAFGHYQVQGSQGNYYNVSSREINGNLLLECECLMYQRNLICSHSLAAATLHSALLRQQGSPPRRASGGNFSSDRHVKNAPSTA